MILGLKALFEPDNAVQLGRITDIEEFYMGILSTFTSSKDMYVTIFDLFSSAWVMGEITTEFQENI